MMEKLSLSEHSVPGHGNMDFTGKVTIEDEGSESTDKDSSNSGKAEEK